jgi:hypothetical protein
MVEAVTEAYAAFSSFLAKTLKFYKESKLTSALKAFGFPWETRFQLLVTRIEAAFRRIREIAQAGHFGLSVHMQHMVKSIGVGQEQLRLSMRQDTIDLRQQLKLEMKNEVQALFDSFDRNWISRFEQIMIQSRQGKAALHDTHQPESLPAPGASVASQYVESMTKEAPFPGKFCFSVTLWRLIMPSRSSRNSNFPCRSRNESEKAEKISGQSFPTSSRDRQR